MFDIEEFSSPIYLLVGSEKCWNCETTSSVVGLASGDMKEPFMLSDIKSMPAELLAAIQRIHPRYEIRDSRTKGIRYYMNICTCGAHFGDYYLFSRPGGAFFPHSDEDATAIQIHELPLKGDFKIVCSPGLGTGGVILKHGKWITGAA
jgi:hypothetical protein